MGLRAIDKRKEVVVATVSVVGRPARGPSGTLIARLTPSFKVRCPKCRAPLAYDDVRFAGMPIFVECHCSKCQSAYLLDWPAGHALLHPTIVEVTSGAVHFAGSAWYPRAIERVLATRETPSPGRFEVRSRAPHHSTAVVANCLDYVYGHCVLKLLSAVHYVQESNVDVILIVPKNVSWLVPPTTHTVIELDLRLSSGDTWIDGLDAIVKDMLAGYTTVRIAPTPSQPPVSSRDLALTAGLTPSSFWDDDPAGPPEITLLLREDRLWRGRRELPERLQRLQHTHLLPRALRHRLDVAAQNRRFARLVRAVHRVMPEARFVAVGLGRTGRLPSTVKDLRRVTIDPSDELAWCAAYARSRVVVGVHGSHMLLPSALAGAVVDLLPQSKLPNIAQDLIIAGETESDPKLCLFRYRVLPERTSPRDVSDVIISILRDNGFHHQNVVRNRAAIGDGWPQEITWRPLDGSAVPGPWPHSPSLPGKPPAAAPRKLARPRRRPRERAARV